MAGKPRFGKVRAPEPEKGPETTKELLRRERRVKVMKMRLEGYTFHQIAKDLGISPRVAVEDMKESIAELQSTEVELANEMRATIANRNERLVSVLFDKALEGDLQAIDRITRINQQMMELYGVKKSAVDVTSGGEKIGINAESLMKIAKQAREELGDWDTGDPDEDEGEEG